MSPMSKAKTLDRLELTKQKFARKDEGIGPIHQGYSICPNCGQNTLIHEDGCRHCRSCGWSACG